MNILVVDDNKSVQDMLSSLLLSQGYFVDVANNGLDALGKAQNKSYQVFIIDHLMPLMNGVQLTKNLKKNIEFKNSKIIFMTTQGVHALKDLPEYSLFDNVTDKPIIQEKFITMLSGLIDSKIDCTALEINT